MGLPVVVLVSALSLSGRAPLIDYKPSASEIATAYARANGLREKLAGKVFEDRVVPHWFANSKYFWYRDDQRGGLKTFVLVDPEHKTKGPAFDREQLAKALGDVLKTSVDASKLPFNDIEPSDDLKSIGFNVKEEAYKFIPASGKVEDAGHAAVPSGLGRPRRGRRGGEDNPAPPSAVQTSPDKAWVATLKDGRLHLRASSGGDDVYVTPAATDGTSFSAFSWSGDSKHIALQQITPGEHKLVYLIESSPKGGGRAVLHQRPYELPGDKADLFNFWTLDIASKGLSEADAPQVDAGSYLYPEIRWRRDGQNFTFEDTDRGHQRYRVVDVDVRTGRSHNLIDEKTDTFIDSTSQYIYYCKKSDDIVWRSEQDGWGHLYLVDGVNGGVKNQITKGNWVVRTVDRVDEDKRQIWFQASGVVPGEDPYLIHNYRVNFDGTGLIALDEGDGNHFASFSPDGKWLVDIYSRVDLAPVTNLRDASDGKLVLNLEKADTSDLSGAGWQAPEVFVAKGRDGKTDIWGIVCRPSNLDPNKKYPIIENLYAGPQDSFVPKAFSAYRSMQALAELGFIVVQCDGMGTRNRSKAFHDVCWHHLEDSGFPDRILWMKALAEKYPYADIDKVGVYGTSAGGQESTAALLFHPEFYKVAVSCAGCHDNRMDKMWWNEQWMGYPIADQYKEASNIENASKLRGKLLLMVGEMDTNVPPESTLRLVDALIKSGKDFDYLMLPGFDHTDGGPYGEHKRRDFFVRHLLGVEPPAWNGMD